MKSRMNREVHVRFCERFGGEIPPYLLDFFDVQFQYWKLSQILFYPTQILFGHDAICWWKPVIFGNRVSATV